MRLAISCVLGGLLAGAVLGWCLRGDSPAISTPVSYEAFVSVETDTPPEAEHAGYDDASTTASTAGSTESALDSLQPTAEELKFLRGALIAERRRRELATLLPTDTGLTTLDRIIQHGADARSILGDYETVRARIRMPSEPANPTRVSDRDPIKLRELDPNTQLIEFGAGTYEIRSGFSISEDCANLEIAGAGQDATILVVGNGSLIRINEQLENLWIRDLTIVGGGAPVEVHGKTAAAIERVTFLDWSSGGHSSALGVSGRAYLACRDCYFGAGSRGGSLILANRGKSIALFESCTFVDTRRAVGGWKGAAVGSHVWFRNCRYENTGLASKQLLVNDAPEFSIVVEGGHASYGEPEWTDEERRKNWGVEYAESVTDCAFDEGTASWTVEEAIQLLELLERQTTDGSLVSGLANRTPHPLAPPEFEVLRTRERKEGSRWLTEWSERVDVEGKALGEDRRRKKRNWAFHPNQTETIEGVLPLSQVLRRSGLPAERGIGWLQYRHQGQGTFVEAGVGASVFGSWKWDAHAGGQFTPQQQ